MNNKNKAIMLMLITALSFAAMGLFVKMAGNNIPAVEKSFFRNIVSCIVALYLIKKSGDKFFGHKGNRKFLIGRALFGTLGIIANFYAIDHLDLSDANMLNNLSPFIVIIFSALFLKEKITKKQMIILCTAFLGSLFIIRPSFSMTMLPALIGLGSAVCAGAAYTFVRFLGGKENGPTIVFFFSFFSIVVTAPFVLVDFKPFTPEELFFLLMAGVVASIGQFALTAAYKYAPAKDISIYNYSQIIFSALFGFFVFSEIPDVYSIIGYIIVICASLYMFLYNKNLSKKEEKIVDNQTLDKS